MNKNIPDIRMVLDGLRRCADDDIIACQACPYRIPGKCQRHALLHDAWRLIRAAYPSTIPDAPPDDINLPEVLEP